MSTHPPILFLINPRSGGKRGARILSGLLELAEREPGTLAVQLLDFAALHDQVARAHRAEIVVIGGGDGTISTLIDSFKDIDAAIGVLPLGTGNDLAKELGLGALTKIEDPRQILNFFQKAKTREFTVCALEYGENFTHRVSFLNYVSFGYDAKVVAHFAQWRKTKLAEYFRGVLLNRIGYAAFSLSSFFHILNPKTNVHLQSGEKIFSVPRCASMIFANVRSLMGLGISNLSGSGHDEEIECVIAPSALSYGSMMLKHKIPFCLPRVLGSEKLWDLDGIPEGTYVQIDGEARRDINSRKFRIRSLRKVRLIAAP